jgi:hypothetical protein
VADEGREVSRAVTHWPTLDASTGGRAMTPEKVISMFELQYLEGKAPVSVEYVCAGFADWLASAWEYLDGEEKTLLMSVGAALWREGYSRRAGSATNDPW